MLKAIIKSLLTREEFVTLPLAERERILDELRDAKDTQGTKPQGAFVNQELSAYFTEN